MLHFLEINQGPLQYSMLQPLRRAATPKLSPRNYLRYLQTTLIMRIWCWYQNLFEVLQLRTQHWTLHSQEMLQTFKGCTKNIGKWCQYGLITHQESWCRFIINLILGYNIQTLLKKGELEKLDSVTRVALKLPSIIQ